MSMSALESKDASWVQHHQSHDSLPPCSPAVGLGAFPSAPYTAGEQMPQGQSLRPELAQQYQVHFTSLMCLVCGFSETLPLPT